MSDAGALSVRAPVVGARARAGAFVGDEWPRLVAVGVTAVWMIFAGVGPLAAVAVAVTAWGFVFGWPSRRAFLAALAFFAGGMLPLFVGGTSVAERLVEIAFFSLLAGLAWALPVLRELRGRRILVARKRVVVRPVAERGTDDGGPG